MPLPVGSIPATGNFTKGGREMAIDAKVSFLGQVERKYAELLTMKEMGRAMQYVVLDHDTVKANYRKFA